MNFARISRPRTRRRHGLHPDGNRVVSQSSSNSNCERIQRAFEDEFEYDLVAAAPRCELCSADIQDRTISRGFLSRHRGKLFNVWRLAPIRRYDGSCRCGYAVL
jgi:hypothetical protein